MADDWNLAIETSSPQGSVAFGHGDELRETVAPHQPRRHNLDLMPAVDDLFQRHGARPADLAEVYVSLGPGSFTGLRIAVAAARMLALTTGARLVGVPTAEVLAHRAAPPPDHLAVCLNLKRDRFHTTVFHRDAETWTPDGDARLLSLADLLAGAPRPLAVIAAPAPETPVPCPPDVTILPPPHGVPDAAAVWHLGRRRARTGAYTEPPDLLPIYARPPEAVEMWEERKRRRK